MTTASKMQGISAVVANAIVGDITTAVSAAGTTQATATVITTDNVFISTCAANAGIVLPIGEMSKSMYIYNGGVGVLKIYPPVGGTIGQFAANIPYFLRPAQFCDVMYSGATTLAIAGPDSLPRCQYVVTAAGTSTMVAGDITGAQEAYYAATTQATISLTTRTATQLFNDTPNAVVGDAYYLRITNLNSGTLTIVAGSGVTLTGTMTLLTNTTRDFVVTFNSATTATIQTTGTGTVS